MIMDDLLDFVETVDIDDIEQVYQLKRGMVRASFAVYSRESDVNALIKAVKDISARKDYYRSQYEVDSSDEYVHCSFRLDHAESFSVQETVSTLVS